MTNKTNDEKAFDAWYEAKYGVLPFLRPNYSDEARQAWLAALFHARREMGAVPPSGTTALEHARKNMFNVVFTDEGMFIDRADRKPSDYKASETWNVMFNVDKNKKGEVIGYEVLWEGKKPKVKP